MALRHCESCGIAEKGDICNENLISFRGHSICSWCEHLWQKKEKKYQISLEFSKFVKGFTNEEIKQFNQNVSILLH